MPLEITLDVFHSDKKEWERQFWRNETGYPRQDDPSEYDPLMLQKNSPFTTDYQLFRVYAVELDRVTYCPIPISATGWLIEALPHFGFVRIEK